MFVYPEEWVLRTPEGVASGFLIKGKGGQSEPGWGCGGRKRAGLDTFPRQARLGHLRVQVQCHVALIANWRRASLLAG